MRKNQNDPTEKAKRNRTSHSRTLINKLLIKKQDDEYNLSPIRIGMVNKGGQGERIYSIKGHAITLSAYGGGVGAKTGLYLTNKGIRKLTVNECKLLMGFPQDHYVSNGIQGYQQLGNAVIPEMVNLVYNSIKVA